jgi:hypothetical protein
VYSIEHRYITAIIWAFYSRYYEVPGLMLLFHRQGQQTTMPPWGREAFGTRFRCSNQTWAAPPTNFLSRNKTKPSGVANYYWCREIIFVHSPPFTDRR